MKKLGFALAFLLLVSLLGCTKKDTPVKTGLVVYTVTSSPAGFDVTYQNSSGGTSQETITVGTWTTSFTGKAGDFVYISAQASKVGETVTAKITWGGLQFKSSTSTGDFVIATASGSLQ